MNGLVKNIKYLSRKISASRISAFSAQTAFFMFMSLVPLVILLFSFLKQFNASDGTFSAINNNYLPKVLNSFFSEYLDEIKYQNGPSMTLISILVLLWSASKGVYAIIGGLNSVYEIKENRNYFLVRAISIVYTVAFMFILVSVLSILVFGDRINEIIISLFPNITAIVYLISSLRFIIGFVLLVLLFALLYKTLPNTKHNFLDQIPGAVIASAGWVSFSILFSFFVDNFGNYSNIYGSLTAIIVLLLWLYVCMYIMFVGAKVNFILLNEEN